MKFKVVALIMLVGTVGMAVSCQKEQIVKNESVSTKSETVKTIDEDPLIKGKVKKSNQMPVVRARVETYDYVTDLKIAETYTDIYGVYEQKVPFGLYYLKFTNPESGNVVYSTLVQLDLLNLRCNVSVIVD